MDMKLALDRYLKEQLASGKLDAEQTARVVDEIHQLRRRVVRPRELSDAPIIVGTMR